jgi:hypothetical protein
MKIDSYVISKFLGKMDESRVSDKIERQKHNPSISKQAIQILKIMTNKWE